MATATKSIMEKAEEVTTVKYTTVPVYILKLEEEEAKVLLAATSLVAGKPDTSYRAITDSIADALYAVGFRDQGGAGKYFSGYLSAKAKTNG